MKDLAKKVLKIGSFVVLGYVVLLLVTAWM